MRGREWYASAHDGSPCSQESGDPLLRRPRARGQRGHHGGGFGVPAVGRRGRRLLVRLLRPRRLRRREAAPGPRTGLHDDRRQGPSGPPQRPRDPHRHVPREPREEGARPPGSGGSGAHGAADARVPGDGGSRGRGARVDRRRRHAQDGELPPRGAEAAARGRAARAGRARAQDDRQRLPRHRLHVRVLHGRRRDGARAPEPAGRREGDEGLFRRRDDGAKGRLARVRRRGGGRGAHGDRRGGHRRAAVDRRGASRSRRHPATTPAPAPAGSNAAAPSCWRTSAAAESSARSGTRPH